MFSNRVPANCEFEICDVEKYWPFGKKFDLIHIRQPIGFRSFKNVINNAYRSLIPGGWLEIEDIMFPLHDDGDGEESPKHVRLWEDDILAGASHLGYDLQKPYKTLMSGQGFKKIKSIVKNWPIGQHAIGNDFLAFALARVQPYSLVHLLEGPEAELWTEVGVQARSAIVRRDIENHKGHLSLQTYVILNPRRLDAYLLTSQRIVIYGQK